MNVFPGKSDAASGPPEPGFSRVFWIPVGVAFLTLQLVLFWIQSWPAPRRPWGDEILYEIVAERIAAGLLVAMGLLWPTFYARAGAVRAPRRAHRRRRGRRPLRRPVRAALASGRLDGGAARPRAPDLRLAARG